MAICVRTLSDGSRCGLKVANGGNMHAFGFCRSPRQGNRGARQRHQNRFKVDDNTERGQPVAGTTGSKAKTHRRGKAKVAM